MIQCINISKNYSKSQVIKPSSFNIEKSKISFLMGPNGAGKTTFIKYLANMEKHGGEFTFDGENFDQVRNDCLIVWDDCPFYTNLSGLKNLIILGEGKRTKKEICTIATKYLDFSVLKRKVFTYSYGQKKKLAIALVEILKPMYLIMDKVSNGLDYEMMQWVKEMIKCWSESMTIILTGHQFSFYNDLVEDVLIFRGNQILKNDTVNNLNLEAIYENEIY